MGFILPSSRVTTLYIDSLGVIDFGAGNMTVTHATGTLTLAGGQFVVPVASATAPSISPVGYLDTGMFFSSGAKDIYLSTAGTQRFRIANDDSRIYMTFPLYLGAAADTAFDLENSGIFQFGSDAAVPAAITAKGPDGSGTDKAGGDFTHAGGRPTGSGTPGKWKAAVSTPGTTGSSQQALVDRLVVDYGYVSFNPVDAAATPVAATAALKLFAYNKSVADDAVVTLPSVTTCGHGTVHVGGGDPGTAGFPFTNFFVDGSGNVVLLDPTLAADVSANTDTDGDLCIGTADPQEPVQVKNRLAATKVLNIMFWYD